MNERSILNNHASINNNTLQTTDQNEDDTHNDYYNILGVDKNATAQQIKLAYRNLILKYHPDKNRAADAITFTKIHKAYITLRDPLLRFKYDKYDRKFQNVDNEGGIYLLESSHSREELFSGLNSLSNRLRSRTASLFSRMGFFSANLAEERSRLPIAFAIYPSLSFSAAIRMTFLALADESFATTASLIFNDEAHHFNTSLSTTFQSIGMIWPSMGGLFASPLNVTNSYTNNSTNQFLNFFPLYSTPTAAPLALPSASSNQTAFDSAGSEREIKEEYICPLSLQIMTDPVHNPKKGLPNVEKSWILIEIERSGKNPFNNQSLSKEDLIENVSLKKEIETFVIDAQNQNQTTKP